MTFRARTTRSKSWTRAFGGAIGALLTAGAGIGLAQTPAGTLPPTLVAPDAVGQAGIATPAREDLLHESPAVMDGGDCDGSVWSRVPWLTPLPRPGFFIVPPTGPGYYSALDCALGKEHETRP